MAAVDKRFMRQQMLAQLDRCTTLAYGAGSHFAQHGAHDPGSMQAQAEADARLVHLIEDYAVMEAAPAVPAAGVGLMPDLEAQMRLHAGLTERQARQAAAVALTMLCERNDGGPATVVQAASEGVSREARELMLLAAFDLESWMNSYHRDAATEDTVARLRRAALSAAPGSDGGEAGRDGRPHGEGAPARCNGCDMANGCPEFCRCTPFHPPSTCRGDPGECEHNGDCMYACGAPPSTPQATPPQTPMGGSHE